MPPSAEEYGARKGNVLVEKDRFRAFFLGAYAVPGRRFKVVETGTAMRPKKGGGGRFRQKEQAKTVIVREEHSGRRLGREVRAFWADDDRWRDIIDEE
jgi:hypothetical protein